ncbi:MAG TPA: tRNA (adenosine(37)-N6)-dimethylallyltransferase MiaA [Bacteroidales bacterium]|nr:tRNA (adenosine(37)-N6)-dimethylallyltransferase MiaA [Bacteroidales bacterium]HQG56097.1 tRNA (adenosine(37)-N6)-dimethylallyltransferase MiaA [Bacteroidales bacterium]HQK70345.1 tRNA (adenosine(37)-N6)-dimethylallyltransferase MiaA [Bacteroidales bacterium]
MQNTLIVVVGPTGVGKTELSIDLAGHFKTEIISCDSRQFYREMVIGTSAPTEEQLSKVRHHFVRFLSVTDYYSASMYERDVLKLLPELFSRNPLVILTGGSGLYVDAVCIGIDDIPDVDPAAREKYWNLYQRDGIESLRIALKLLDPDYYRIVDLKNHKRIIRALEICETTGRPYSSFLKKEKRQRDFRIIKIGLERPRDELYTRINERVDRMIGEGLVEEAHNLLKYRHLNALQTLGYKELFEYFDGKITLETAISLIKRNSRRYAKRQITWWARDKEIRWFNPLQKDDIIMYIETEVLRQNQCTG